MAEPLQSYISYFIFIHNTNTQYNMSRVSARMIIYLMYAVRIIIKLTYVQGKNNVLGILERI